MTVYDIVSLNRELLKRLHKNGIKTDDYKWLDLYNDYMQMKADGDNRVLQRPARHRKSGMDDGVFDAQVGRTRRSTVQVIGNKLYFYTFSNQCSISQRFVGLFLQD